MLARNHFISTLLFSSALLFSFYWAGVASWQACLFVLAGSLFGVLLPDVDAVDSNLMHRRFTLKWFAGMLTKWFSYKPVVFLIGLAFPYAARRLHSHRGFMHSLLGLLCTSVFWLAIGSALFFVLPPIQFAYAYFLLTLMGMSLGFFLHLWQDALTVGGVRFLTGIFSGLELEIKGTLHTDLAAFGGGRAIWERDIVAVPAFALFFVAIVAHSVSKSAYSAIFLGLLLFPLSLVIFRCKIVATRARKGPL